MKKKTFQDYLELTKMRLVTLVLLSSAAGYYLAPRDFFHKTLFAYTMIGTALVAAGSMALNELWEKIEDAKMKRTAHRPIPTGKIRSVEAFALGLGFSVLGLYFLYFKVNPLACFYAALTLISYVLVYTPLKKVTNLCTLVGAIPGALPPLIGWAAAINEHPGFRGWILFAIVFIWQIPHFLAIAWMFRDDYENAGFKMISGSDPTGAFTGRQILLYSVTLLPVSLLPTMFEITGKVYFWGALLLGVAKIIIVIVGLRDMNKNCRFIFRASLIHLSLLLLLMVMNRA